MSSPVPPPNCPAHGLDGGALARLHEADDPMALYGKLRAEHGSVAPVVVQGDLPAWLVLGYQENLEVARNPSRFARDPRTWSVAQEGRVPADHPLGPMLTWWPVVNFTDGPAHERLRDAVTDSLERFGRRGIRRYVDHFANQLIDGFVAKGQADLVEDFAGQLPMLVMTQLIGAPDEHGPLLVQAVRDMLQGTQTALTSDEYVTSTLQQLVKTKRASRGHDLTSWLLDHPSDLSEVEVLAHVRVVLVAAYETTANLIANTLRVVLTDRRFRANLSGGQMTLPDALEQVLWDQPPLNTVLGRWAIGDTVVGSQQIRAGDMLLLSLAAGNVDPAIRPNLDEPVHGNRAHLAFSSGAHECPGQDIGRAIADTGIEVLLGRLPDLELSVPETELQWRGTLMSQHLVGLPVTFTAGVSRDRGAAMASRPSAMPLPEVSRQVPLGHEADVRSPQQGRRPWWVRWFSRR